MAIEYRLIGGQLLAVDADTNQLSVIVSGLEFTGDVHLGEVQLQGTDGNVIQPASQSDVAAIVTQLTTALALPTGAATEAKQDNIITALGTPAQTSAVAAVEDNVKPFSAVVGRTYQLAAANTPEHPIATSTPCRKLLLATPKGTDGVTGTNTTTISIVAYDGASAYIKIAELPPHGGPVTLPFDDANLLIVQGATPGDTINIGILS